MWSKKIKSIKDTTYYMKRLFTLNYDYLH